MENQPYKEIYKSSIRVSYFGGMQNGDFIRKSRAQLSQIHEKVNDSEVDEKTFRLFRKFKRPVDDFVVYNYQGKCFLEKESFFSCFGKRKPYDIKIKNSKFMISYKNEISRFIDFDVVEASLNPSSSSFTCQFKGIQEVIYVEPTVREKGKQQTETRQLTQTIQKLIKSNHSGTKKKFRYLLQHSPDFFKSEHILNSEFEKYANSGDILLFKSQHSAARLQRIFTDSQYDHVGIVLRNAKNQLFIYESTSNEGVGLTPWSDMIKYNWYDETDKICWRPLNLQLGQKQIEIIQTYVIKTLGKGFQLNIDKLFQFKSKLVRTDEEEEKKTYFCSELAARLYKELGIFDEEKSSTNYFPVDFSQKGKLNFVKPGVSLGNQKIISFDGLK